MSDLVSFTFEQSQVRVIERDDAPWWIAADLATILGYSDTAAMTRSLDSDEKGVHVLQPLYSTNTPTGGQQEMTIISESGLYNAIFRSRRPEAQAFRRWVTGTVLPQLRRTGSFHLQPANALDRLKTGLIARTTVTTAEAATLAGIVADNEGQATTAGLLRALGWRRAWIAPTPRLEG
jgi:prophage antirepressor-like protein